MAISKGWTDWAVVLDAETKQAGTATYINGVSGVSLNMGLVTALRSGDGSPYNTNGFLTSGEPTASFTTSDLGTFLDECAETGMLINSGINGDGVILYQQKYALGGTRETLATALHHSTTIGDGILFQQSINLPHRGRGVLTASLRAVSSNGVLSPLTFSETSTLPTSYPTVANEWTLGKVYTGAVEITGVSNVSINFGITVATLSADAHVYPTSVFIRSIQPSITITSNHIDFTTTATEAGVYYASGFIVYARHRATGGTYVADATQTHISFALGKCRLDPMSISGQPDKVLGMTVTPWYTAGASPTLPITIDTTAAIA